jgi:antitoxin component of MazEF toxin-antitoxin module
MATKLCVWGNSLGVRLPKYVAEVTGVQPGDYLFITVNEAGEIVIRPVKPRDVHSGYGRGGSAKTPKTVIPKAEEQW